MKNGDKDKFELHLRNLLNNEYGLDFTTNNIKITFPDIEEKEICMLEIKAGLKPLYTTIVDGMSNKAQKFYVRSGNSSQEVALNEVAEFVSKRFDN